MNYNYIIGGIFIIVIAFSGYKAIKSIRNNSCPGCSCGCSKEKQKSCKHL